MLRPPVDNTHKGLDLILLLLVLHQPDSIHDVVEDLEDLLGVLLGLVHPSPGHIEPSAQCTSLADNHAMVDEETLRGPSQ